MQDCICTCPCKVPYKLMASVPSIKGEAFNPTPSSSKDWVLVTSKAGKHQDLYRPRTGALTKCESAHSPPSKVTTEFKVEEPTGVHSAFASKAEGCSTCASLQNELEFCMELNDSLIRKFSRIIQLLDKGKKLVEEFEKEMGLRLVGNVPSPAPVFIASQNVCLMDEKDIIARKESGQEYQSIDLTANMFPVSDQAVPLSEIDRFCQKFLECLEECRAVSLSSANLCFESRAGFFQPHLPNSGKRDTRPPLKRMHTLSNDFSLEHSLELGSVNVGKPSSRRPCVYHIHSEHLPDKKSGTLIRTHSENELTSSNIESRVLLMENESISPLPQINNGCK